MLLNMDPVIVEIGPFAIRWYGVLMALSIALGFYYFRRDAMKLGYDEDFLYNVVLLAVIGGIIGARAVYVATNWPAYAGSPLDDHPHRSRGPIVSRRCAGRRPLGWVVRPAERILL